MNMILVKILRTLEQQYVIRIRIKNEIVVKLTNNNILKDINRYLKDFDSSNDNKKVIVDIISIVNNNCMNNVQNRKVNNKIHKLLSYIKI